jgi:hypothetical protein
MDIVRSLWYVSTNPASQRGYNEPNPPTLIQVLNCQDYYFAEYTTGSQIILQDAYPIGVNATWSTVWNTPCTPELGDCGCDNCKGQFEDIADRVDQYRDRLVWQGRSRDTVVWSVPQAFGGERWVMGYP